MKQTRMILLVVLALVVGLFVVSCGKKHDRAAAAAPTVAAKTPRYHCPMHPTYTSDKPGDCPICGMALVPIGKAGEASTSTGAEGRVAIHLTADRIQQIGLTTAVVEKRKLSRSIRTVGRVTYAEPRLAAINTKFNGWVEKLHVNSTGQPVKKDEPLLDVYSPELVAAQNEYLIAFRGKQLGADGESLLASSRRRLKLLDLTDEQIAQLEASGEAKRSLTISSPFDGVVVEKAAVEGKAIVAGENLYRIADLSVLWINADLYESDLPLVKTGQEAIATFTALPGDSFKARISYIYPYLEEQTRTAKARLEVPNPDGKLKPDMWANVEITVGETESLSIPASAAIQTGQRYVAFVDKGEGHLEPRELKIGAKTDDFLEVREGVSEGEKVVTRALFLVDSESQLRAAISGMGGHEH